VCSRAPRNKSSCPGGSIVLHVKAASYTRYGPPDVIQITDVEKPVPKDKEVLLKVCAASVNPYDWHFLRGTPYFIRISIGLSKPKDSRLGADVAGEVVAVGPSVTRLKPGDAVFGLGRGSFAEYACAPESSLALKPGNTTFEQAAAVPIAALTALQGLRAKGGIQPGQKVLINGAAGGVGTFAVQIARSFGAEVTGVCSTRNLDLVRGIGAEHVIDYTRENFTKGTQRYDLILDAIGNHPMLSCRRALTPKGALIIVGAQGGPWMLGALARGFTSPVLSRFVSQTLAMVMTKPSPEDLATLHDLMKSGSVTPAIDRRYPLDELPEAIRYVETTHARGKVVITP
jgi:NADPH:quinone reductase-like Zn-dependent oxidoreductase